MEDTDGAVDVSFLASSTDEPHVAPHACAVGPLEDQTALSLGPEVKGKCFPPGRTSNVFNMQRQKYQFVARKQAQVKGGGHSATN